MREITPSEQAAEPQRRRRPGPPPGTPASGGARKPRPTAIEYVGRMDLSPDRRAAMLALARRFEGKSFLPTCADIGNFCRIYGIEKPASKARAGAIPRVFKFVAAMEAADIQRLLDENAFSGPARLGPLAEAIRESGRSARWRDSDGDERGDRSRSGNPAGSPMMPALRRVFIRGLVGRPGRCRACGDA